MIFETWKYSKPLFILIACFIALQLFFSFRFAAFSHRVDHKLPISHPVATESFPFVNYTMYSGKTDDWGKYSYLKIEADGQEIPLSDFAVNNEEQILNPTAKFLDIKAQNFDDAGLYSFLQYSLDSSTYTNKVYNKASNVFLKDKPDEWGQWLVRYLSALTHKDIHSIKIYNALFSYNNAGKPVFAEQQLVYQYSK